MMNAWTHHREPTVANPAAARKATKANIFIYRLWYCGMQRTFTFFSPSAGSLIELAAFKQLT
jgi:hypothetical protein